jgi:hypothetical protein
MPAAHAGPACGGAQGMPGGQPRACGGTHSIPGDHTWPAGAPSVEGDAPGCSACMGAWVRSGMRLERRSMLSDMRGPCGPGPHEQGEAPTDQVIRRDCIRGAVMMSWAHADLTGMHARMRSLPLTHRVHVAGRRQRGGSCWRRCTRRGVGGRQRGASGHDAAPFSRVRCSSGGIVDPLGHHARERTRVERGNGLWMGVCGLWSVECSRKLAHPLHSPRPRPLPTTLISRISSTPTRLSTTYSAASHSDRRPSKCAAFQLRAGAPCTALPTAPLRALLSLHWCSCW